MIWSFDCWNYNHHFVILFIQLFIYEAHPTIRNEKAFLQVIFAFPVEGIYQSHSQLREYISRLKFVIVFSFEFRHISVWYDWTVWVDWFVVTWSLFWYLIDIWLWGFNYASISPLHPSYNYGNSFWSCQAEKSSPVIDCLLFWTRWNFVFIK